jgi:hypothetical protein
MDDKPPLRNEKEKDAQFQIEKVDERLAIPLEDHPPRAAVP